MKRLELIAMLMTFEGNDDVILENNDPDCNWAYVEDVDIDYINEVNKVIVIR